MRLVPRFIGGQHRLIQHNVRIRFQRIQNADDIRAVDHAARTDAAAVVVQLISPENRHAAALFQRKRVPIVAQQHSTLSGGLPGGRSVIRLCKVLLHVHCASTKRIA